MDARIARGRANASLVKMRLTGGCRPDRWQRRRSQCHPEGLQGVLIAAAAYAHRTGKAGEDVGEVALVVPVAAHAIRPQNVLYPARPRIHATSVIDVFDGREPVVPEGVGIHVRVV